MFSFKIFLLFRVRVAREKVIENEGILARERLFRVRVAREKVIEKEGILARER